MAKKSPANWRSRILRSGDADPTTLVPNPANWRTHPALQAKGVRTLLNQVGWVQQVVVNERTGHLVDGHLRLALAIEKGEKSVPVLWVDLTEKEEATILAALDPVAAMAGTDTDQLEALLRGIGADPGTDLDALLTQIGKDAGALPQVTGDPADPPEPSAPPTKPITKRGDLILLGRHRLLCGDSTAPEDVKALLGELVVDCVFTDPPYAVYGSSTGIAADITDDKMIRPFFRDILSRIAEHLKPFGHFYVCCDWRSWASWWEVGKGTGLAVKNMIVWDKMGAGLGSNYANTHELLLFGSRVPTQERMTKKQSGIRSVNGPNVWRFPRVKAAGTDGGREHNAQKPLELVEQAIGYSTVEGNTVLDLFGGSGTTLIAAERLKRRAAMMEIEPGYCDVIVARWEKLTGQKAERPKRKAAK